MLAAYDVSLQVIRELRGVVPVLKKHDRDLANQLQRAASSVCLNIAEGRARSGGDQRHSYEIAAGSAGEVDACLDVADAWGWAVPLDRSTLRRLCALLYGLTHGPRALRA